MAFEKLLTLLGEKKLGFFGCGHLAKCFLTKIIDEGFPREKILVSHGNSEETKNFLEKLKVDVVNNEELCKQSKLILYFVRPQEYQAIKDLEVEEGTILLSFLAGITIEKTKNVFSGEVIRAIPSSPVTINSDLGLVAIYPEMESVMELFSGFKQYSLKKEEDINAFIAIGTCLPNVNVFLKRLVKEEEIKELEELVPIPLKELLDWVEKVTPKNLSDEERKDYLTKAATKGGINEAIITALKEGKSVKAALLKGLERNQELNK
jgi:pyrroline-5-carboxylate reductase